MSDVEKLELEEKVSENHLATEAVEKNLFFSKEQEERIAKASAFVDQLSGQQKVAAILIAMGKSTAAKLLKHFSQDDLRALSQQAKTLPDISPSDFEELVSRFEDAFADGAAFSEADLRFKKLITDSLSEEEAESILNPSDQDNSINVWETIVSQTPEKLYSYISKEHPQVIAYICSKLPQQKAARFLLLLPTEMRSDIISRQLLLSEIRSDAEMLLKTALNDIFLQKDTDGNTVHYKKVASILNELDKDSIEETLANLTNISTKDIETIKKRIFVFDDIVLIDDRSRMILFNDLPIDMIILSLRRAEKEIVEAVLSALSPRSRRIAEIELGTPDDQFLQEDIEKARRYIAQEALTLADRGVINLKPNEEH